MSHPPLTTDCRSAQRPRLVGPRLQADLLVGLLSQAAGSLPQAGPLPPPGFHQRRARGEAKRLDSAGFLGVSWASSHPRAAHCIGAAAAKQGQVDGYPPGRVAGLHGRENLGKSAEVGKILEKRSAVSAGPGLTGGLAAEPKARLLTGVDPIAGIAGSLGCLELLQTLVASHPLFTPSRGRPYGGSAVESESEARCETTCVACQLTTALCLDRELPWTCRLCNEIQASITVATLRSQLESLPADAKVLLSTQGGLVRMTGLVFIRKAGC